eukprot:184175-Chlamydomonas_euryale.AAC.1
MQPLHPPEGQYGTLAPESLSSLVVQVCRPLPYITLRTSPPRAACAGALPRWVSMGVRIETAHCQGGSL